MTNSALGLDLKTKQEVAIKPEHVQIDPYVLENETISTKSLLMDRVSLDYTGTGMSASQAPR